MTLGIARPVQPMSAPMPPRAAAPEMRPSSMPHGGEDPARIRATIARAPLFAALPINAIEDLTARISVRRIAVGAAVVAQDEPGDAMFIIMSGRIALQNEVTVDDIVNMTAYVVLKAQQSRAVALRA
jgi:hypothetical protein